MERLNASRSPVFYGFLLAFECLMWGVSNSVSKLGFSSISPMWCLALRYALSTLLFLAAFGKRFFTRVRKKDLLPCTLVSLATASAFIFGFLSLVYTTATSAGFLMALAVVIASAIKKPALDSARSRNCAVSFHSALEGKTGCAQSRSCCNRCGGDVLHLRRYVFIFRAR